MTEVRLHVQSNMATARGGDGLVAAVRTDALPACTAGAAAPRAHPPRGARPRHLQPQAQSPAPRPRLPDRVHCAAALGDGDPHAVHKGRVVAPLGLGRGHGAPVHLEVLHAEASPDEVRAHGAPEAHVAVHAVRGQEEELRAVGQVRVGRLPLESPEGAVRARLHEEVRRVLAAPGHLQGVQQAGRAEVEGERGHRGQVRAPLRARIAVQGQGRRLDTLPG
eukprot:CAMPEP_0206003396 /NCGR_PEP_ID=MMETSP1464-20131121/3355_1 /ASSEMBLY_ACC=CAM_ASM_001124 /TAXON_ID=119497 /ORGANISM="Exanthemachrysis gayraliae, Strain RCC1523" /LENGTH=220 /DNA_ID=CAMNT_0053376769 /DNA_START=75 /DNA_END=734 /DNA_ORIENTATION=+